MNVTEADELQAATDAAMWLETLKSAGDTERIRFADWLRASPLHVRQFLLMTAAEKEFESFVPVVSPVALAANDSVARGSGRGGLLALAACLALAVIGGAFYWWFVAKPDVYVTAVGEHRKISLADGSVVELSAMSQIEVDYSSSSRDVKLVAGEAFFDVKPDAARAFSVHVGSSRVQAIGTLFNIDRRADGALTVAVLGGRVKVSAREASLEVPSGKATNVTAGGQIAAPQVTDVFAMAAWRDGRLVFSQATLAEVVEEFSRYNQGPAFVVEGAARGRRLSASLSTDPELLLELLSQDPSFTVGARSDGTRVIRLRSDVDSPVH